VWLVDAGAPAVALAAVAAAASSGGLVAMVDGADLRRLPEVGRALRSARAGLRRAIGGEITADASWQLPVLLEGRNCRAAGYLMFPGRRLVALYGHAWAPELGALGSRAPGGGGAGPSRCRRIRPGGAGDRPRLRDQSPRWPTPGPATTATTRTRRRSGPATLDRGRGDSGVYVLLDLQPGRTDFLTQALLYEEFLRLPYVGLALDPEWRLRPGEFHLQQYGSVPARRDQRRLSAWLAGLVRAERLPQKDAAPAPVPALDAPDREQVAVPPELAVVIQMDGREAWTTSTRPGRRSLPAPKAPAGSGMEELLRRGRADGHRRAGARAGAPGGVRQLPVGGRPAPGRALRCPAGGSGRPCGRPRRSRWRRAGCGP